MTHNFSDPHLLSGDLFNTLVPLQSLMPAHREDLLNDCEIIYAFEGDQLFDLGQFDRDDYYLLNGEVLLDDAQGIRQTIKARSTFTAIDPRQPHSSRAVAATDATFLKVNRGRQNQLLAWSQAAEHLLVDLAARRDLDEDAVWLDTVLCSNLFLKVPPNNVSHILKHLKTRIVEEGEVIIRQGDLGDSCYFIKEGVAEVTRNTDYDPAPNHVADISEGRCFGEDALIQETVRNANVVMKTPGVLLVLDKQEFLPLLKEPVIDTVEMDSIDKDASQPVMLDVRTEAEYNLGHFTNAVNLPLHLMHLKRRILDPAQSYITCCNTGTRARVACQFLKELGYSAQALQEGLDQLPQAQIEARWSTEDFILKDGQVVVGH